MSTELLSADEIAHVLSKTSRLRYDMSSMVEASLKKSLIFEHHIRQIVNQYFKQFLDCPDCQHVDEELSQRYLSRRNAVVKKLVKKFAEAAAFKMVHIPTDADFKQIGIL